MKRGETVFVLGSDTAPEVVMFAASIGRVGSGRHHFHFICEEPEETLLRDPTLARLVVREGDVDLSCTRQILCGQVELVRRVLGGGVFRLSIATEPGPSVRLETDDRRYHFPLAMCSPILRRFGRAVAEIPRVVVTWEDSESRRERMIKRTREELIARRWPHVLIVVTTSTSFPRVDADEVHLQPEASDMAALIASSTLMVEPVEGDESPSALSCLASSVGVPVVTHTTGFLMRRKFGELRGVEEWSPDAFADAIIETAAKTSTDLSWGAEFDVVAEDFGRVIQSA